MHTELHITHSHKHHIYIHHAIIHTYIHTPLYHFTHTQKVTHHFNIYALSLASSPGQFGQLTPKEKGSEESKKIQAFRECLEALPIAAVTYGTAVNPHLWDNPKRPFGTSLFKKMGGVCICVCIYLLVFTYL